MVEPLLIAAGAAAYLLLKPKKMTPEKAQEQIDQMPQEQLEEQVPQTITVTPAPAVVEPAPVPDILLQPSDPAPPGKRWMRLPASRQPDAPMVWRLVDEPTAPPAVDESAAPPPVYEPVAPPAVVEPETEPKTCVLVKSPSVREIPMPPEIEEYTRKSEENLAALKTGLEAAKKKLLASLPSYAHGEALKVADRMANDKMQAEKDRLSREVQPFIEAWEAEKRAAEIAANAEFQAKLQEYEGMGWSIHQVPIRVTNAESGQGSRSVVYACPPGVEPEAFA